jgi:acetyl-CoA acyltransferase
LAAKFGVTRREQDELTVMSHLRAAKAHADGLYKDELFAVDGKLEENGIKGDTSLEKVSKLPPAFIKPHGTHTAANSSFLTDGGAACLIMSEEKALALGYKPKAYIRTWSYVGVDPFDELLLGPTFATSKVLQNLGLTLKDIGVVEFHEAFAGQVLANIKAMASDKFAAERLPGGKPIGEMDFDKMNALGGSLAIGHPFGATGCRLVTTAANRLQREQQRFALLTACADGGLAHACILERYDNK